jgi:hypothetical protein
MKSLYATIMNFDQKDSVKATIIEHSSTLEEIKLSSSSSKTMLELNLDINLDINLDGVSFPVLEKLSLVAVNLPVQVFQEIVMNAAATLKEIVAYDVPSLAYLESFNVKFPVLESLRMRIIDRPSQYESTYTVMASIIKCAPKLHNNIYVLRACLDKLKDGEKDVAGIGIRLAIAASSSVGANGRLGGIMTPRGWVRILKQQPHWQAVSMIMQNINPTGRVDILTMTGIFASDDSPSVPNLFQNGQINIMALLEVFGSDDNPDKSCLFENQEMQLGLAKMRNGNAAPSLPAEISRTLVFKFLRPEQAVKVVCAYFKKMDEQKAKTVFDYQDDTAKRQRLVCR